MCAVAVKEEDFAVGQWGSEGKASNAASDSSSPLMMSSFLSLTHHVMGALPPRTQATPSTQTSTSVHQLPSCSLLSLFHALIPPAPPPSSHLNREVKSPPTCAVAPPLRTRVPPGIRPFVQQARGQHLRFAQEHHHERRVLILPCVALQQQQQKTSLVVLPPWRIIIIVAAADLAPALVVGVAGLQRRGRGRDPQCGQAPFSGRRGLCHRVRGGGREGGREGGGWE